MHIKLYHGLYEIIVSSEEMLRDAETNPAILKLLECCRRTRKSSHSSARNFANTSPELKIIDMIPTIAVSSMITRAASSLEFLIEINLRTANVPTQGKIQIN